MICLYNPLMKIRLLIFTLLLLAVSCSPTKEPLQVPATSEPAGKYQYQIGLGYGFLDRRVQVFVDSREILSITGTEEIEEFAQLLGTKMLAGGSTDNHQVTVRVIVDGGLSVEEVIDLSTGRFIHVYNQETGLQVFNTNELILE
jgi:hypothetical protein